MGYLNLSADTIAAYGTLIFLVLDVITLILIGVFTQRIGAASSRNDISSDDGRAPDFPLTKLQGKHRNLVVPTSSKH
ncbi:MAG TPA: hypothetical protein VGU61_00680 [Noviherbaspirillum sp.]|jgi:hypothetical protein|uniref:hypothetical protein n=1 Tax=Noviherbaspirillum sp. TaxID=1926288 RepID=UPI002DDD06AE|nr:hypothetical protein [Noviherbaspirillum sp.]HEV2608752.1 hypothetical protein [Noviherbaspirillum sp.]